MVLKLRSVGMHICNNNNSSGAKTQQDTQVEEEKMSKIKFATASLKFMVSSGGTLDDKFDCEKDRLFFNLSFQLICPNTLGPCEQIKLNNVT